MISLMHGWLKNGCHKHISSHVYNSKIKQYTVSGHGQEKACLDDPVSCFKRPNRKYDNESLS